MMMNCYTIFVVALASSVELVASKRFFDEALKDMGEQKVLEKLGINKQVEPEPVQASIQGQTNGFLSKHNSFKGKADQSVQIHFKSILDHLLGDGDLNLEKYEKAESLKNAEGVTLAEKLLSKMGFSESDVEFSEEELDILRQKQNLLRLEYQKKFRHEVDHDNVLEEMSFQELGLVGGIRDGKLQGCFRGDWKSCTKKEMKPVCHKDNEKDEDYEQRCNEKLNHVVLLIVVAEEGKDLKKALKSRYGLLSTIYWQEDNLQTVHGWKAVEPLADKKNSFTGRLITYTYGELKSESGQRQIIGTSEMRITVVHFAQTESFGNPKAYSGWTQSGALATAVALELKPSLTVCYGTSGGYNEYDVGQNGQKRMEVGDIVYAPVSLFLDRIRFKNDRSFQWGMWGGASVAAPNLEEEFKAKKWFKKRVAASQEAYPVEPLKRAVMDVIKGGPLDMEAASEAQIFAQFKIPYLVLRIISNRVYPGNPAKQHGEYTVFKQNGVEKGAKRLAKIIGFLHGRSVNEL